MDSLNLFDDNTIRRPVAPPPAGRSPRPLWLILLTAGLLPGLGHILLGKTRAGIAILLTGLGLGGLGVVAMALGVEHLSWLSSRGLLVVGLFGILDAAFLCHEIADGRDRVHQERPRLVAFLNLVGYGAGYWRLDERKWALIAGIQGLVFQGVLGAFEGFALVLGELVLVAAAVDGYRVARHQHVRTGNARPARLPDTTPRWLLPTLGGLASLAVIALVGSTVLGHALRQAMEVEQGRAVVMEPYYRNPDYGLSVEMQSPGWTFDETSPDEFLRARHLAEDAAVNIRIRPRIPLLSGQNEAQAQMALEEARGLGYSLMVEGGQSQRVGRLDGYALRAQGFHRGQVRNVEIITAGKGFRQFLIWFEWGEGQDFAMAELNSMMETLALE